MARWLVQLEGDPFDLEEFPYWFPDGDVYAIAENGTVYITGPAIEALKDSSQVREAALQAVDEFSAVIALLWSSLQRPSVGHVYRDGDDGKRQTFAFGSATATARCKVRATGTVDGVRQERREPTQAQRLLAGSRVNHHLQVAVSLWADPLHTWPRLYRILEEIEMYLKQTVAKAGLCSDNQRERFTRSANTAEIAGKDARHSLGKFVPPPNPMDLAEATSFVAGLLQPALLRAASEPGPASDAV